MEWSVETVLSQVNSWHGTPTTAEALMLSLDHVGPTSVLVAHELGVHGEKEESYAWAHDYGLLLPRLMWLLQLPNFNVPGTEINAEPLIRIIHWGDPLGGQFAILAPSIMEGPEVCYNRSRHTFQEWVCPLFLQAFKQDLSLRVLRYLAIPMNICVYTFVWT